MKIAAQVKGFDARERLDFKSAKRMELFTQYAAAAAKEAFEDAGIDMGKGRSLQGRRDRRIRCGKLKMCGR